MGRAVVLEASTGNRPIIREPFVEDAVADVLERIGHPLGPDVISEATATDHTVGPGSRRTRYGIMTSAREPGAR